MLGKTYHSQFDKVSSPDFRSVLSDNSDGEYSSQRTRQSVTDVSLLTSQKTANIAVIAPFTSNVIIAHIFNELGRLFPCRWSVFFDPTEQDDEFQTQFMPWTVADCILILGARQPISEAVFRNLQSCLNNAGRIVYWGDIAPNSKLQYKFIGATPRGEMDHSSLIHVRKNSSQLQNPLLNNVNEFCPIGRIPRFSSIGSDCDVLLTGQVRNVTTPVAWTRQVGQGKLFYSSLADESDWLSDDCLNLLLNAVRWAIQD